MFKINSITDAVSAVVALKHPTTGEDLGATVTLAGPEHPKRKALDFARQRKQRAAFNKTGKIELPDPEDDAGDAVDTLTACTLAWDGLADDAGNPITFTPDAAASLYGDEAHGWLRTQLLQALNERERFIVASPQA